MRSPWKGCFAFIVAALALTAPEPAGAQAAGGPELIPPGGIKVAAVEVRGNQQINRDTILGAVSTKPGGTVTREQLAADVTAIKQLGFFRSVSPEVTVTPEGARITFVVEEYPPIRAVEFTGNTVFTQAQLRPILGLKEGEILNREVLSRKLRAIEDAYSARGYVAQVSENVSVQPQGILVVPIHEAHVAQVEIEGLRAVHESVIRRALRLRPGDLYSTTALQRDYVRLQQLNLFDVIEPDVTANAAGNAVIHWRLREMRTRQLTFGLSYSPAESLVGTIGFIENNFRGQAEQLRVALDIGTIEGRIGGEASYAQPVFVGRPAYNGRVFSAFEYRFAQSLFSAPGVNLNRYYERHNGVQIGATQDLGRGRQVGLNTRYEDVSVNNLPPQFLTPATPSLNSTIYGFGGQALRDRRDSIIYPTTGDYAAAIADFGFFTRGSHSGSGFMARPQVDWRSYIPLNPQPRTLSPEERQRRTRVLAWRVMGGTATGHIPFFEQFFVGGVNNLRGYAEDRFWGPHMLVGSAELRWPLFSSIVGVAFVDAGQAWGSDYQFTNAPNLSTKFRQTRSFSPRFGTGVGVRYLSPFGPLRLDFAYGDQFRVHFTIGQAF